jgi:hypothetical protein
MLESSQIERMSVVERLQAIEQLWEAVCREAPEVSSPEWHGEVFGRSEGAGATWRSEVSDFGAVAGATARGGPVTVVTLEDAAEDSESGRRFYESRETGIGDFLTMTR